jgi:hypothetical protein
MLLSFLFVSCKNGIENSTPTTKNKILQNTISFPENKDSLNVLSFVEVLSSEKLDTILKTNFFKRDFSLEIKKYFKSDSICIYSIKVLNNNLSNDFKKDYVVVDVKIKKTQYIFQLEINQIFEIDKSLMFGGIYNYREYDYYVIYKIENKKISSELDTRNINGKTIVIGYYKDDECIDYLPDRFPFYYDAVRKKILFEGIINNYCKNGTNRFENSKINSTVKSTIYFKHDNSSWLFEKEKSNYYFW